MTANFRPFSVFLNAAFFRFILICLSLLPILPKARTWLKDVSDIHNRDKTVTFPAYAEGPNRLCRPEQTIAAS